MRRCSINSLQIGILALVREGKRVAMTTNSEAWAFGLHHDGQYGENVLGVTVEKDRVTEVRKGGDTCTTVSDLSPGKIIPISSLIY